MKKTIFTLALLMMTPLALAADPVKGFQSDLATAKQIAKKANKPLYLHFTTDWCGWCRRIEKDIYKTPEGKAILKPFVPVSLNCTQGKDKAAEYNKLMVKFGGRGYPYLAIIAPDGQLLLSFSGYKKMPEFKALLAEGDKRFKKYNAFTTESAKADKASPAYLKKAMAFYTEFGNKAKAAIAADELLTLQAKGKDVGVPKAQLLYTQFKFLILSRDEKQLAKADAKGKEIIKLDADNKLGLKEDIQMFRAKGFFQAGMQAMAYGRDEQGTGILKRGLAILDGLLKTPKQLKKPAAAYALQSRYYILLGQPDKANVAWAEALPADPKKAHMMTLQRVVQIAQFGARMGKNNPTQGEKLIATSEGLLAEMLDDPSKIEKPMNLFVLQGRLNSMLKRRPQAIAAYKKALSYKPADATATKIQNAITALESKNDAPKAKP